MRLISIDPGATPGYAVFHDGTLTHAGLGLPDMMPDELIIELPEWRKGERATVNDLIALAFRAGCAYMAYPGAAKHIFKPSQWKGSVPKTVHHPRILAKLEPHETAVIKRVRVTRKNPLGYDNNTLDAIGLGLVALKRMGRGGV